MAKKVQKVADLKAKAAKAKAKVKAKGAGRKKTRKPKNKHRFVLSVGDEGAILVMFNGSMLEKRLFITSPSSQDLTKALEEKPNAPISILVDILDQSFVQHTLPPVSPLAIGNLVKKRLEKDFGPDDIKAARQLFREKTGRKDWHYLFVSLSYTAPFSDWVEAVINLPNPFGGIYLLPLETEPFLKKLEGPKAKKKASTASRWHILVSHNRISGFRQIVYRDNKVVFTRIAQPIGGLAPDVIAGNIEQEVMNTVEYIRRLGFDNTEELDIYIICSQDVKAAIDDSKLSGRKAYILTPHDIATQLNLPGAAEKTDRFGDVVMASFFINHKRPVLRFETPYSKKIYALQLSVKAATLAAGLLAPLFLLLSILSVSGIMDAKEKVDAALQKRLEAEKELEEIRQIQSALPDFSAQAVDIVEVNQSLTKETRAPLSFMDEFALLRTKDIEVRKLETNITNNLTLPNKMETTFYVLINNPSGGIDRLLEDIDRFTDSVRKQYRNYEVSFSGLPGQASSDTFALNLSGEQRSDEQRKKPFEIKIKGPIGESPSAGKGP